MMIQAYLHVNSCLCSNAKIGFHWASGVVTRLTLYLQSIDDQGSHPCRLCLSLHQEFKPAIIKLSLQKFCIVYFLNCLSSWIYSISRAENDRTQPDTFILYRPAILSNLGYLLYLPSFANIVEVRY